jgi:DNA-binding NtrC family response regulator
VEVDMDVVLRRNTHRHIVVVEDDDAIRELLYDTLTEEGYSVTLYPQASDAVFAALQARPPALLICDLHIPGLMTGVELLHLVAIDARTRRIPIILCSASQGLAAIADTFRGYSIRVLMKPFDMDDLFATVTAALDEAGGSER